MKEGGEGVKVMFFPSKRNIFRIRKKIITLTIFLCNFFLLLLLQKNEILSLLLEGKAAPSSFILSGPGATAKKLWHTYM